MQIIRVFGIKPFGRSGAPAKPSHNLNGETAFYSADSLQSLVKTMASFLADRNISVGISFEPEVSIYYPPRGEPLRLCRLSNADQRRFLALLPKALEAQRAKPSNLARKAA